MQRFTVGSSLRRFHTFPLSRRRQGAPAAHAHKPFPESASRLCPVRQRVRVGLGTHRWSTCTSGLLPMNSAPRTCSAGISSGKLKGCARGVGLGLP